MFAEVSLFKRTRLNTVGMGVGAGYSLQWVKKSVLLIFLMKFQTVQILSDC